MLRSWLHHYKVVTRATADWIDFYTHSTAVFHVITCMTGFLSLENLVSFQNWRLIVLSRGCRAVMYTLPHHMRRVVSLWISLASQRVVRRLGESLSKSLLQLLKVNCFLCSFGGLGLSNQFLCHYVLYTIIIALIYECCNYWSFLVAHSTELPTLRACFNGSLCFLLYSHRSLTLVTTRTSTFFVAELSNFWQVPVISCLS